MFDKSKLTRDAFTFSLRGMTVVTPYAAAPAIADDHLNRIRDERLRLCKKRNKSRSENAADQGRRCGQHRLDEALEAG